MGQAMREPLSSLQLDQYLRHIGVTPTDGKPCMADLRAILTGHLCTIPYENLITVRKNSFVAQLGIEPTLPDLDNDAMVDTLVHRKRSLLGDVLSQACGYRCPCLNLA